MNISTLADAAFRAADDKTPDELFAFLENEFGKGNATVRAFRGSFEKWQTGALTPEKFNQVFAKLQKPGAAPVSPTAPTTAADAIARFDASEKRSAALMAKVSSRPTPAQVLQAATDPRTNAAAIQGLNQSLAARLGLTEQKVCTKAEFDSLSFRQKSEFSRNGGRISQEPKASVSAPLPGAKSMSREQFRAHVPAIKQAAYFRDGGQITE